MNCTNSGEIFCIRQIVSRCTLLAAKNSDHSIQLSFSHNPVTLPIPPTTKRSHSLHLNFSLNTPIVLLDLLESNLQRISLSWCLHRPPFLTKRILKWRKCGFDASKSPRVRNVESKECIIRRSCQVPARDAGYLKWRENSRCSC